MTKSAMKSARWKCRLLPLRDVVVFPAHGHSAVRRTAEVDQGARGRDGGGKSIMLVAQKNAAKDEPAPEDLYDIGCIANILQMLKLPDGTVKVLVEGSAARAHPQIEDVKTHFTCQVTRSPASGADPVRDRGAAAAILQQFDQYVKLNKKIPPEILTSLAGIDDAGRLGRHHRRAPAAQARAEAGSARDARRQGERLEHLLRRSRGNSTSCRSRSASAAASSARWRRASASTT
jgi:ATP-dependent Lon protease